MIDLAIIIVSWNVKVLLAACLRTVQADLATSGLTGAVWVVDNASTDGSVELVRRDFPQVRLLDSPVNLGFAGGNNAALRAMGFVDPNQAISAEASGDLPEAVLLLNPDTEVQPGALRALYSFLKNTPQAGVAGANLVYEDGSFQHGAFALPGLWQLAIELLPGPGRLVESRLNGRYPRRWYDQPQPFEIGHPLGAAMCVRAEAIKQVGLLDEGYHMYVEEVDWSRRILATGWRAYCVPQAKITHFGGQSTGQVKVSSFLDLWRSRYRFYRKTYSPLKVWLAGQIVWWGMQRKIGQARKGAAQGALNEKELLERVQGYQQVIKMWQGRDNLSSKEKI